MNRFESRFKPLVWFMALLLSVFLAACGGGGSGGGDAGGGTAPGGSVAPGAVAIPGVAGSAGAAAINPTVASSTPSSGATNVATSTNGSGNVVSVKLLTATFSEAMLPGSITPVGVFTLKNNTLGGIDVPGTVAMSGGNTIATFTPGVANLNAASSYTATISTAAKNAGGTAMPNPIAWSFTTAAVLTIGQGPVDLGAAGNFVIFSNTAVTSVFPSNVKGNIGTAGTGSGTTITCPEITAGGKVWSVDATYPDATCLTIDVPNVGIAAGAMAAAITDAKGRTIPDFTNLGAGNISGLVLAPGLYKWTGAGGVTIDNTGITITGSADDVWIFQITGDLTVQNNAIITLGGSAQAKNIFWQVGGVTGAVIGSAVQFKGIILADAGITLTAGSTVLGRLFANPAITLITNTITPPAP
jgi:hypothetical protein